MVCHRRWLFMNGLGSVCAAAWRTMRGLGVMTLCAVGAMALSPISSARANDLGIGNDFYSMCANAKPGDPQYTACVAYMKGLHDMASFWIQERRVPGACPPAEATLRQYYEIFLKYLADRPTLRDKSSAELFHASIRDAFPCSR